MSHWLSTKTEPALWIHLEHYLIKALFSYFQWWYCCVRSRSSLCVTYVTLSCITHYLVALPLNLGEPILFSGKEPTSTLLVQVYNSSDNLCLINLIAIENSKTYYMLTSGCSLERDPGNLFSWLFPPLINLARQGSVRAADMSFQTPFLSWVLKYREDNF